MTNEPTCTKIETKPPLGIMPEWGWKRQRLFALINAISRYDVAGMDVPDDWLLELRRLLNEIL